MRAAILCAVALTAPAAAEEQQLVPKEEVTEVVNAFSDCAGLFEAIAKLNEQQGKRATAETVRGQARGAQLSAQWLLANDALIRTNKVRPLGDFTDYVTGRAEINETRIYALFEGEDRETLQIEQQRCVSLLAVQKDIIQEIRDELLDR